MMNINAKSGGIPRRSKLFIHPRLGFATSIKSSEEPKSECQNHFTRSILIDEKAIPHSHPVLTLPTRHLTPIWGLHVKQHIVPDRSQRRCTRPPNPSARTRWAWR